ncbi:hypothetical protein [Rhodococcus koreensis]|uniref:hypothetical protein n=1 Tax=Rhodococcus koreensis TaxID=99653 RepID=UPI0036D9F542
MSIDHPPLTELCGAQRHRTSDGGIDHRAKCLLFRTQLFPGGLGRITVLDRPIELRGEVGGPTIVQRRQHAVASTEQPIDIGKAVEEQRPCRVDPSPSPSDHRIENGFACMTIRPTHQTRLHVSRPRR